MSKQKSMWNRGCALLLENADTKEYHNYHTERIYQKNKLMAMNRFKWEGLPKGLEGRYIEQQLFDHGEVSFFLHPVNKQLMCLKSDGCTDLNEYGEPIEVVVTGTKFSETFLVDDVVRLLNNDLGIPTCRDIYYYSSLIAETEKSWVINLLQQRFPFVFTGTKDNEATMNAMFTKLISGDMKFLVDKKISSGSDIGINCLKTGVPYLLDKFMTAKRDVEDNMYTDLGINNTNANNNKKERLLVDEVNVNNGQILMNLEQDYKRRLDACKMVKEKFGIEINVVKTIDELSHDFMGQKVQPTEGGEM